jgi:hypothetical protein
VTSLFGIETEYALSASGPRGNPVDRGPVLRRILQLAFEKYPSVLDRTARGVFLANGARFYADLTHPEYSTPEVANPWDVVRYAEAGDRFLAELAAEVAASSRSLATVQVFRCNVDYGGTGNTWGVHESYMYRSNPAALPKQLIPHLVSRLIYSGAGGFNSRLPHAAEFTLSPRVWHLQHTISGQSTHSRGIFHTKDEPMATEGYHRLHILCGESLCSETAAWLKVAATALIVALIDAGVQPGECVQLKSPLEAMRRFASDPTCRVRAATGDGRQLSALEIQRHYLSLAEAYQAAPWMPPWAGKACLSWRALLDRLEDAPGAVTATLDWAIKLALFRRQAGRRGVSWETLARWNEVARTIGVLPEAEPPLFFEEELPQPSLRRELRRVAPQLAARGLAAGDVALLRQTCQELFELDMRFGQLGPDGLFPALDRAGVLSHRFPGVDNVEHAMAHPPAIGRGRVRAALVRELSQERNQAVCDWDGVFDWGGRRWADLSDPFARCAEWQPWRDAASTPRPLARVCLEL